MSRRRPGPDRTHAAPQGVDRRRIAASGLCEAWNGTRWAPFARTAPGRANPARPSVLANDRLQDARIPARPTSRSRPTAIPHAAHSGHGVAPSPLSLAGPGSSLGQRRHRRQVDGVAGPTGSIRRHGDGDTTWPGYRVPLSPVVGPPRTHRKSASADARPPPRRAQSSMDTSVGTVGTWASPVPAALPVSGRLPQANRASRTMAALMSLPRPCDRSDGSRRPQDGYRVGGSGLSFREPNRPRKPTPRRRPGACQVCPDRNAVFSDCAPIHGATDRPMSGERDAEPERPRRSGAATSGPRAKA